MFYGVIVSTLDSEYSEYSLKQSKLQAKQDIY